MIQSHLAEACLKDKDLKDPMRILKENKIFPQILCKCINDSLITGAFADPLKLAEITPIHIKEDPI